jgi:hypothetical protein
LLSCSIFSWWGSSVAGDTANAMVSRYDVLTDVSPDFRKGVGVGP